MCLNRVLSNRQDPRMAGYGYKLVGKLAEGGYCGQYDYRWTRSLGRRADYPWPSGQWLSARYEAGALRVPSKGRYRPGFHVWLNKPVYGWRTGLALVFVEWKGLLAVGVHGGVPTIVAERIRISEEL